jgi:hypothetical protein
VPFLERELVADDLADPLMREADDLRDLAIAQAGLGCAADEVFTTLVGDSDVSHSGIQVGAGVGEVSPEVDRVVPFHASLDEQIAGVGSFVEDFGGGHV